MQQHNRIQAPYPTNFIDLTKPIVPPPVAYDPITG
jgi:hypothetical protein